MQGEKSKFSPCVGHVFLTSSLNPNIDLVRIVTRHLERVVLHGLDAGRLAGEPTGLQLVGRDREHIGYQPRSRVFKGVGERVEVVHYGGHDGVREGRRRLDGLEYLGDRPQKGPFFKGFAGPVPVCSGTRAYLSA